MAEERSDLCKVKKRPGRKATPVMVKQVNLAMGNPHWLKKGQEAIEGMRMPTPAMLKAGANAAAGHVIGGAVLGSVAIAVWQAMIEEAVNPSPEDHAA